METKITAAVVMPNSPIQAISATASDAVTKAFAFIGGKYRQMSDATKTAAKTYDGVEQALADQFRRYVHGDMLQ